MNKRPDYMGWWVTPYGGNSMFFMTIRETDKDNIKGTIEDKLGIADFEGGIKLMGIFFTKTYHYATPKAPKEPIQYQGTKIDSFYEGSYKVLNKAERGKFILLNYPASKTMNTILEVFRRRLSLNLES